ncbi:MAG: hypothetical protein QOK10_1736 [Pseudonocardiales bacterium]|jgi:hypothetical protein|nr:hypothetical protein [Pseudonocardiales bacterium]
MPDIRDGKVGEVEERDYFALSSWQLPYRALDQKPTVDIGTGGRGVITESGQRWPQ